MEIIISQYLGMSIPFRYKYPYPRPKERLMKNMKGRKYSRGNYETMEEGTIQRCINVSVVTGPGSLLDKFYIGGLD
jgi:hypothetical protein